MGAESRGLIAEEAPMLSLFMFLPGAMSSTSAKLATAAGASSLSSSRGSAHAIFLLLLLELPYELVVFRFLGLT